MNNYITRERTFWVVICFYIILFFFTCRNGFFWDTTHLASLQASWYYDNNFRYFFLPQDFDSGHPPFFAMLLAFLWKIFGVNLFVGHTLIFIFLIVLIVQVFLVSKHFFREDGKYAALLILFNPIVMAQSTLVSPDIVLFCFFFLVFYGIVKRNDLTVLLSSFILCCISMRGMMCAVVLFLFYNIKVGVSVKSFYKVTILFLPGAITGILFLILHYQHTGWIGYHSASPWVSSFERVNGIGFFRNIVVFFWRMADMGMIFIWLIFGVAIITKYRAKPKLSMRSKELILFWIICFVVTILPQFFYKQLLMHRYLLPLISITTYVFFSIGSENLNKNLLRKLSIITVVGVLSGNLWVFPDKVAKGWDSTLAHLPYYKLRLEALSYLHQNNIPLSQVSAAFPYNLPGKCIDLNNDTANFSNRLPQETPYLLYSNIANEFTDEQLADLKNNWKIVAVFGGWPVRFVLYKNPAL